jgi:hypothetical protein
MPIETLHLHKIAYATSTPEGMPTPQRVILLFFYVNALSSYIKGKWQRTKAKLPAGHI